MNVAVYTNKNKDKNLEITNYVVSFLKDKCNVLMPQSFESFDAMCEKADALIVLGGDGTLLRVSNRACLFDLPVLGINLGTIGFLAEVEKNKIESCLNKFLSGDYSIEERFMFDADVVRDGKLIARYHALNDVVVSSSTFKKIVSLNLYVNDEYITSYAADGMIFATPTGSTAYSLSAGGPITDSAMELIIVTPICAHSLFSRPLILPPDKKVTVEILKDKEKTSQITIDGAEGEKLIPGDKIDIYASKKKTKLIRVNGMNFYEVLRKKLSD